MKFLKGFLVFILIAVIIGGIGYIGYSFLFMGDMNHSSMNSTTANAATESQQNTDTNSNQNDQSMSGMAGMPGMESKSSGTQSNQNNNSQQSNNQLALNQANLVLQNKDKLDKSAALINEALKLLSVDPYAPSDSTSGMNMQQQTNNEPVQPTQESTSTVTDSGNNTTINIYPQGNSSSNTMASISTMSDMGTTYDSNKMDQLHSGLYKIAIGTALMEQLKSDITYQAENAAGSYQDAVQYYSNQYNLTVQNKNKLNQIMTYLNEAANLVNINPYVSSNGLVYDKDRMNQIHQSIQKLAEGVVSLNGLSDDFTKQTISLTNTVQNYVNNANQQMNNSSMSMPMSSGLFGGLFDNISMASVVNIVLILFVIGLVFGILGFVFSLLKSPAQKVTKNEEKLTTNS